MQQVREKYTQNNAERLQKELNEIKGGREGFLLGLTNYKFFISKAEGDKNSAAGLRISSECQEAGLWEAADKINCTSKPIQWEREIKERIQASLNELPKFLHHMF